MKKYLQAISILCIFLIVNIPIVYSQINSQGQFTDPNPYSGFANPNGYSDKNFGGSVYNDPFGDYYRRQAGGYSYGQPISLGESIIVNVADYEPKQVRESLLDQSNVPVYFYLKGTTLGTVLSSALSPLSEDPEARDPLSGITNIPKIEYIDVSMNSSSFNNQFILGSPRYVKPVSQSYSLNNLGAIIVYLKKLEPGAKLPEDNTIKLDMNANIYFNIEDSNLIGLSRQDLTLKPFPNEQEFIDQKEDYKIFSGKGYVRAINIDNTGANIQVFNRDLLPLGLISQNPRPTEQAGLDRSATLRLVKGGQPQTLSFGYTGNPLLDTFRISLDDISVPTDRAEIEFVVNGRKYTRKINVGSNLMGGSDWVLKEVKEKKGEKVTKEKILKLSNDYQWSVESQAAITNLLNSAELIETEYTIILENGFGEQKTIVKEIVIPVEDDLPEFIKSPDENLAKQMEKRYCPYQPSNNGKYYVYSGNNKNYACEAVARYRAILDKYPQASEIKLAIKDLAEIYENELIQFDACNLDSAGKVKNQASCNSYKNDMAQLATFYYEKIGLKDRIKNRITGTGGEDYLEDIGVLIRLNKVEKVNPKDSKILIKVYRDGKNYEEQQVSVGDTIKLNELVLYEGKKIYEWRVENINPESVTLRLYNPTNGKGKAIGEVVTLGLKRLDQLPTEYAKINPQGIAEGKQNFVNVEVSEITNLREAYITVLPGSSRGFVNSQFSINIPIDPRPFKWTPEQLKSQIEATDSLIKKIDGMVDKLDSLVRTWKKLCLGMFALLTLKSSLLQGSVRAQARRVVSPIFKEKCQFEVNQKASSENPDFDTVDECLSYYGKDISKAVDAVESGYEEANKKLEDFDKISNNLNDPSNRCGEFEKYKNAASTSGINNVNLLRNYRDCYAYSLALDKVQDKTLKSSLETSIKGVETSRFIEDFEEAEKITSKIEGYSLLSEEKKKEVLSKALSSLREKRTEVKSNFNEISIIEKPDPNADMSITKAISFVPIKDPKTGVSTIGKTELVGVNQYIYELYNSDSNENKLKEKVCKDRFGGSISLTKPNKCQKESKEYDLDTAFGDMKKSIATAENGRQLYVKKNFFVNSKIQSLLELNQTQCEALGGELKDNNCNPKFSEFSVQIDQAGRSINSEYSYSGNIEATYNNNGLVACYPVGEGNYVKVVNRYQGDKGTKDIQLWNVGSNGRIECGSGDDEIQKTESELKLPENLQLARSLINKEPRGKCNNDGDVIGKLTGQLISCRKVTADQLSSLVQPKCIDVMEPEDCKVLFNFCDPVMCPSSRCTLGGRVPPRNVIQSGIIGSTVLCFPNIAEGIAVPVCLTGIDAGLKNVRSLLQGYRDCLDIKLNKGEDVGFCDYIRSVGVCEMMWREASNLLSISGGLVDWSTSKFGDPEGGAEYLKFQSSLRNVEDSVRVFTNEYKDTYTAQFLGQSSDEIGTQICRLSVNGKIPSVGKILDQLTEPENPPQFTAFFDEAPYASPGSIAGQALGIPYGTKELSLYKVFYHIYAGTGYFGGAGASQSLVGGGLQSGIQQPVVYQVYLINRELGLPTMYVTYREDEISGGFQASLKAGAYAQKSVQKVGPKGYNQVCVMINGQESCGFGKVASSFGINEFTDAITTKQLQRDINSSLQCTADDASTPGLSALRLGALTGVAAAGGSGLIGSASATGGSNFGAQAGATITQGTSPAIGVVTSGMDRSLLSNGIVRICAISEPTLEPGRWEDVGSCGSDNGGKSLGECWLDKTSINIQDRNMKNDALLDLLKARGDLDISQFIDPETSRAALITLEGRRNEIINSIRDLVEKAKKEKAGQLIISSAKLPVGKIEISKPANFNSFVIREKADKASKQIGSLPAPQAGSIIEMDVLESYVDDNNKRWYKINYNNIEGWIMEGPSIKRKLA
ncbi:hypothetical protein J4440_03380 [Candidatus Woesearchaeota archaeon]|nr:hypothetical protein [Candidatus Woesearchaeota archaeon]